MGIVKYVYSVRWIHIGKEVIKMKIEMANEGITVSIRNPTIYIKTFDFPKGRGKVIYRTVQVRKDKNMLINLDYDKHKKLVGIEILEWKRGD